MTNPTELVAEFLEQSTWADTTLVTAGGNLRRFCEWCDAHGLKPTKVSTADVRAYRTELVATLAPATVAINVRHLRAFYGWLVTEGEVAAEATRPLGPLHGVKAPTVHETDVIVLAEADYRRLVDTCPRTTEYGRRDEAILSLMWWSGLRRIEVAGVNLADLDLAHDDGPRLRIGSVRYATKNKKLRHVPLSADTVAALRRYLRARGDQPGPLFLSKSSRRADRRLTSAGVGQMVLNKAKRVGLEVSPGAHSFRRAAVINGKRRGISDSTLMVMGGWSDARQYARYTRMEAEELAIAEFHRLDPSAGDARRRGRRIKPTRGELD
jgi:site-specific recombinase XerD